MARPLRIVFPGAVYHITSRGNNKKKIFKDDQDRRDFLEILYQVNTRYNWLCHAYCLMDNHYHLLLRVNEKPLSGLMRRHNSKYAS